MTVNGRELNVGDSVWVRHNKDSAVTQANYRGVNDMTGRVVIVLDGIQCEVLPDTIIHSRQGAAPEEATR